MTYIGSDGKRSDTTRILSSMNFCYHTEDFHHRLQRNWTLAMPLSGPQISQIAKALHSAFARNELDLLLFESMDRRLDDYTAQDDYETQLVNLVHKLSRRAELRTLLAHACEQNPTSEALAKAYEEICTQNLTAEVQENHQLPPGFPHSPFDRCWPLAPPSPPERTSSLSGKLGKSLHQANFFPFSSADSLEEVGLLFGKRQLFWRKHPVFAELESGERSCVVVGGTGSGKTALAWALGRYLTPRRVFACRFTNAPAALTDLADGLASELIHFLRANPCELMRLTLSDHQNLAKVLLTACGDKDYILSRLAEARSGAEYVALLLPEDTGTAIDPATWEAEWRAEEQRQIALLGGVIDNLSSEHLLPKPWLSSFLFCLQRFDFDRVRLVFDDPVTGWSQQADQVRHDYEAITQHHPPKIQTVIITADRRQVILQRDDLPTYLLHWQSPDGNTNYLQQMIFYRAGQFGIPSADVLSVIGDGGDLLRCANGCPGRWARLWQHLLKHCRRKGTFEPEDIQYAAQHVM